MADVGDFGKYGILRALCREKPRISLGVVWYLFPNEPCGNDGRHVGYLEGAQPPNCQHGCKCFRACDPDLYDVLAEIWRNGRREVASVRDNTVLPRGTQFFEDVLTFDGLPPNQRTAHRDDWLARALRATTGCELVFFDPDNGLETASTHRHHLRGPKHVFFTELAPFLRRGQGLVVYHHLSRTRGGHRHEIEFRMRQLSEALSPQAGVFAIRYRRGTARAFFVVPANKQQRQLLWHRASTMAAGNWGTHGHLDVR